MRFERISIRACILKEPCPFVDVASWEHSRCEPTRRRVHVPRSALSLSSYFIRLVSNVRNAHVKGRYTRVEKKRRAPHRICREWGRFTILRYAGF